MLRVSQAKLHLNALLLSTDAQRLAGAELLNQLKQAQQSNNKNRLIKALQYILINSQSNGFRQLGCEGKFNIN